MRTVLWSEGEGCVAVAEGEVVLLRGEVALRAVRVHGSDVDACVGAVGEAQRGRVVLQRLGDAACAVAAVARVLLGLGTAHEQLCVVCTCVSEQRRS